MDFWVRVARDEAEDEEVREFFCARGITAAADFPAALYYRKLVKVDPRRIGRGEKLIPALTLLRLHETSQHRQRQLWSCCVISNFCCYFSFYISNSSCFFPWKL